MAIKTWNGTLEASNSQGATTGVNLKAGSKITVVATGFGSYKVGSWYGSSGKYKATASGTPAPDEPVGAIILQVGDFVTSIGGGLMDFAIPSPGGEVKFRYNDRDGFFDDNDGSFDLKMRYDDADVSA